MMHPRCFEIGAMTISAAVHRCKPFALFDRLCIVRRLKRSEWHVVCARHERVGGEVDVTGGDNDQREDGYEANTKPLENSAHWNHPWPLEGCAVSGISGTSGIVLRSHSMAPLEPGRVLIQQSVGLASSFAACARG